VLSLCERMKIWLEIMLMGLYKRVEIFSWVNSLPGEGVFETNVMMGMLVVVEGLWIEGFILISKYVM